MAGQLIRMFLADGISEGIRTLEISNKTVFCTVFPRPMHKQFKTRHENDRPGVYILVGYDDASENAKIYIGEGDPVGPRLSSHYGNKDFWTDAIVFTSKDNYLSKTQIQYIESKLIKLAGECQQAVLDNGNIPQLPNISEADEAEVSGFLESILLLVKALGYNFFEPLTVRRTNTQDNEAIIFECKSKGAHGKMLIRQDKYVLLADSITTKDVVPSAATWVSNIRRNLLEKQILVEHDAAHFILTTDTEFKSASTAGSVVVGNNTNGLRLWKHNGQSLADFEQNNQ